MILEKQEKIIITILSALLVAGSLLLYTRHSGPFAGFTVIKGALKEETPLSDIGAMLDEARKVNINTASREELLSVPGIGEKTAEKIREYRDEHGDLESLDDLVHVEGIGEKKLERMRPYLKTE